MMIYMGDTYNAHVQYKHDKDNITGTQCQHCIVYQRECVEPERCSRLAGQFEVLDLKSLVPT